MSTESSFTAEELKQFTGSEQFYRHGLSRNHVYTEGVQFLAERAQAYWLLDKIALHGSSKIARERFQVWKLTVNSDCSAVLTTEDGNNNVLRTIVVHRFPAPRNCPLVSSQRAEWFHHHAAERILNINLSPSSLSWDFSCPMKKDSGVSLDLSCKHPVKMILSELGQRRMRWLRPQDLRQRGCIRKAISEVLAVNLT